jgi:hypothetical protein
MGCAITMVPYCTPDRVCFCVIIVPKVTVVTLTVVGCVSKGLKAYSEEFKFRKYIVY